MSESPEMKQAKFIFLFLIMSQVIASLFLAAPVLVATKNTDLITSVAIARYSFEISLLVAFIRNVLTTSLAITSGENNRFNPWSHFRDFGYIVLIALILVMVSFPQIHGHFKFLLVQFGGLLLFGHYEYLKQILYINGEFQFPLKCDVLLIIIWLSMTILLGTHAQHSMESIIFCWQLSIVLPLVLMVRQISLNYLNPMKLKSVAKLRRSLTIDFVVSSGAFQLFYFFSIYLTTATEVLKIRLMLLVLSPSSVIAQSLTLSGLKFVMADPNKRRQRLAAMRLLIFAPTFLIIVLLKILSPAEIVSIFGEHWKLITPSLIIGLGMVASQALSAPISMRVRWTGNPTLIKTSKLWAGIVLIPALLIGTIYWGLNGLLVALISSNIYSFALNHYLFTRFSKLGIAK